MEHLLALLAITMALLLVAASPGPAFILVTQQALAHSRRAGIMTALGLAVGSLIWVSLVFLGIAVVFQKLAWVYVLLKLLGGAYLIYLGLRLWLGATKPLVMPARAAAQGSGRAFRNAVLVQMLNPKAAVFFGSVFLTLLPPDAPGWVLATALGIVFVVEFGWYALLARVLSSQVIQRKYADMKIWFERLAGVWLAFFGVKLVLSDR